MGAYLMIAFQSAMVYLFILVAIRLFGKKELAQLSIIDLVFILLISNAVQNAMVGSNVSLSGGLVAAGTLFVMNYLFKTLIYRFPRFSIAVQGHAVMLIYDGQVIKENLVKSRISLFEIEEAAREHGVASLDDVDLAILEVDGNISILSNDFKTKTKRKKKHYRDAV